MNIKAIIQDPQAAIVDTWGSLQACPDKNSIDRLLADIADTKHRIKQIKQTKAQVSRRFKDVKNDPRALETLKSEMAAISSDLSAREEQRKSLEASLLACFAPKIEAQPAPFPTRFSTRYPGNDNASGCDVVPVSERDAPDWDTYVEAHAGSSLYHLYAWRRIIERSFGHRCYYYATRNGDGRISGVLPLVQLKSRLFGSYAVSVPFFNYGGVLADNRGTANALLHHAKAQASRLGWEHVEYRTCDDGLDLPSASRKVSMILKLPNTPEELDATLKAKVRAQFKQANRHQLEVVFGGTELLDDYYRVFARNMRDLGTPVYAKSFFKNIADELPGHCTLVVVKFQGKPVGVAFLAGYKNMLEIPWASTLREYNSLNVNMWMYRQILGYAIDEGYGFFDFGRSTIDAGTYQFKKQWGAKPLRHHWYYHLSPGQALPELNPDNPKYRLAVAAWKRLPVFAANKLGPPLVKNLP